MNELKTCPFCGGETRKLMCYDLWKVSCSSSYCPLNAVTFSAEEWNTRHIQEGYALVPVEAGDWMFLKKPSIGKRLNAYAHHREMIKAAQEHSK